MSREQLIQWLVVHELITNNTDFRTHALINWLVDNYQFASRLISDYTNIQWAIDNWVFAEWIINNIQLVRQLTGGEISVLVDGTPSAIEEHILNTLDYEIIRCFYTIESTSNRSIFMGNFVDWLRQNINYINWLENNWQFISYAFNNSQTFNWLIENQHLLDNDYIKELVFPCYLFYTVDPAARTNWQVNNETTFPEWVDANAKALVQPLIKLLNDPYLLDWCMKYYTLLDCLFEEHDYSTILQKIIDQLPIDWRASSSEFALNFLNNQRLLTWVKNSGIAEPAWLFNNADQLANWIVFCWLPNWLNANEKELEWVMANQELADWIVQHYAPIKFIIDNQSWCVDWIKTRVQRLDIALPINTNFDNTTSLSQQRLNLLKGLISPAENSASRSVVSTISFFEAPRRDPYNGDVPTGLNTLRLKSMLR